MQLHCSIPNTFLNLRVLALYLNPLTSLSAAPPNSNQTSCWHPEPPSTINIARFCYRNLVGAPLR
ncbi:hypothetical protein BJ165DRAFT_362331 [Panaeolus papilionaceus]|nr:hypothetical protein BJ165DRAFT_362331 [Panaeolus papilionaceus]